MPVRLRKFIGLIVMMAFLALYVVVAASASVFVPDNWMAHLAYYALAGTLWGVPLLPLIKWMSREP